jgi:glycosyltransferase involved in cell wall biosynthesis
MPQKPAGEPALRYITEGGTTGYRTAAVRLTSAVRAAGIDVELLTWHPPAHPGGRGEARHDDGVARSRPGTPTVMHLVPEHLAAVRAQTTGPLVIHTVWETDRLPSHWPALVNGFDGLIVPSAWNRDVFAASGVQVPIEVVPHVACEPLEGDRGAPLGIPDDVVVFYTISRWDERKAPALVVEAFLEAFTADDPVALVIKTGPVAEVRPADNWGHSSPRFAATDWQIVRLMRNHPRPPHIHLIVDEWDEARIAGLHARGDCYVTLTHGEGWGIGSFDACVYGNPVIAPGWSAHLEYLAGSPTLVDYDLVSVAHWAVGSYEPGQRWAQPHLDHAVELMRRVAENPAAARAAAAPLGKRALERFGGEVVAEGFIDSAIRLGLLGKAPDTGR